MSWVKTLVSVPEGHRSARDVVLWWEARRLVFNAVVLPVGFVNLIAFAYINDVLLKPYLPFCERDWEPITVLLAPIGMNIAYTSGAIAELLLRIVLGRDVRRFGPTLFCVGLGFSLLCIFMPPVHDGLRWVSIVTRAHPSISTSGANLTNFTGCPWGGIITTRRTCSNGEATTRKRGDYFLLLSRSGSSGLTFTTKDGCVLHFTVSGDTASLSNGPVTCRESTGSGAIVRTFSGYTLSTRDGLRASGTVNSSTIEGALSCNFADTISAGR